MTIHPWKVFKDSGNNFSVKATQNKIKNSFLEEFQNYILLNKESFIKSDAGSDASLGLRGRESGSCCSMGIEFQSCEVKNFQRYAVQQCAYHKQYCTVKN